MNVQWWQDASMQTLRSPQSGDMLLAALRDDWLCDMAVLVPYSSWVHCRRKDIVQPFASTVRSALFRL